MGPTTTRVNVRHISGTTKAVSSRSAQKVDQKVRFKAQKLQMKFFDIKAIKKTFLLSQNLFLQQPQPTGLPQEGGQEATEVPGVPGDALWPAIMPQLAIEIGGRKSRCSPAKSTLT